MTKIELKFFWLKLRVVLFVMRVNFWAYWYHRWMVFECFNWAEWKELWENCEGDANECYLEGWCRGD